MRIYISIPITGHDPEEQRAKAERFAGNIFAIGHDPINPFYCSTPPEHFDEKQKTAYCMGFDIADLLLLSDAAYFSRGWEQNKWCRLEHAAAEIYGLKIYYELDKIPEAE